MERRAGQGEWIHRAGAWCASWRAGVLLVVLCAAVYLPGFFGIASVDRDESRFAQASRQMLESPDARGWLIPKVQDRPRLNKPPLIYWLQASSAALFTQRWETDGPTAVRRDAIWMYRVPSLLAGVFAVLATWRIGMILLDPRAAVLGAALFAVCPLMTWEAKQARADMALLAATTAALWALAGLWRQRPLPEGGGWGVGFPGGPDRAPRPATRSGTDWPRVLALWIAVGVGVLTKGFITPMVVLFAAGALAWWGRDGRWLARLHLYLALVIPALMIGPWVYLVAREVGFREYADLIYAETIGRSLEPREGHWGPPGYHLLMLIVIFFPGSMLAALAVVRAFSVGLTSTAPRGGGLLARGWQRLTSLRAARPGEAFLLAVVVPSWIVFECVGTKLPHYTMPLYPALALLCARGVLAGGSGAWAGVWSLASRLGLRAWTGLAVVFALVGAGVAWVVILRRFGESAALAWAGASGVAIVLLILGMHLTLRRRLIVRLQLIGLGIAVAITIAIGASLPYVDEPWVSRRLGGAIDRLDPMGQRPLALVEGYPPVPPGGPSFFNEDSMIYESRGRAERLPLADAPAWLAEHPGGLLIADLGALPYLPRPNELTAISGFNYSKGRNVTVLVVEAKHD